AVVHHPHLYDLPLRAVARSCWAGGGRRRVAGGGRGAATGRHVAAEGAVVVEGGGDGRDDVLQLLHVRHPPVGVAREARAVESRDMLGEGVRPGIGIAHIVDRAIHAELLPHQAGIVVGDRPIPIVRVAERCPLLEVTILTRARTRNHVPAAVPAGRLPRRGAVPGRGCSGRCRGGRGRRGGGSGG